MVMAHSADNLLNRAFAEGARILTGGNDAGGSLDDASEHGFVSVKPSQRDQIAADKINRGVCPRCGGGSPRAATRSGPGSASGAG